MFGFIAPLQQRESILTRNQAHYHARKESDPLKALTLALILFYSHKNSGNETQQVHWRQQAMTHVFSIGLNRYPSPTNSKLLSNAQKSIWKRLWWSTYLMDQSYALTAGQNPYITEESWNVPLIEISDFSITTGQNLQNGWALEQLARKFVEKVWLCTKFRALKSPFSSLAPNTRNDEGAEPDEDYEIDLINFIYNGIEPQTWKERPQI
jgi:hypothetical protein